MRIQVIDRDEKHLLLRFEKQGVLSVSLKGRNADGLLSTLETEEPTFEDVFRKEKKRALNRALVLLRYKRRTKKELSDRLEEEGVDDKVVADVIGELLRAKFLDDEAYAESYIDGRGHRYGARRLAHELKMRGVAERDFEHLLPDEEYETLLALARKRVAHYRGDARDKQYRKLYAYLMRRGFQSGEIRRVLRQVLPVDEQSLSDED